ALLAVFKAGAAYVPVDPNYPPDRIAYILGDARPVIASDRPQSRLSYRTTKNPRSTNIRHNWSSHQINGPPRPITSSNGRSAGSPRVS
ncbi:AMP-binding protein, partial [Kibdelosporangium lantanae]